MHDYTIEDAMPSLTLKNVPSELLERLRSRAEADRRSLNQEAIVLLDEVLRGSSTSGSRRAPGVGAQPAWKRLVGKWAGDDDTQALVDEIYRRRSKGRKVAL